MAHESTSGLMICPSCSFANPDDVRYCIRCRLSFHPRVLFLTRSRDHLFWILRRANAGFITGTVAWFFIPALSRVFSQTLPSSVLFFITGVLGGAFLGTVDGMIDESTPKTIRGAAMGALGGGIGGFIFGSFQVSLTSDVMPWAIFAFWATAGATIGLVSSVWEKRAKKIIAGVVAGIIGGGTGGAIGYMMYANLTQQWETTSWILKRLQEGFSGGLIGVSLWFCISVAERFVIFKRVPVAHSQHKKCSFCHENSPLFAWYCGSCGAVLQEAASAAALHLNPFTTLDRLREMFRFLSRLSVTTGILAGIVVFCIFLTVHKVLAVIALLLAIVIGYSVMILFSALSETVAIIIKK